MISEVEKPRCAHQRARREAIGFRVQSMVALHIYVFRCIQYVSIYFFNMFVIIAIVRSNVVCQSKHELSMLGGRTPMSEKMRFRACRCLNRNVESLCRFLLGVEVTKLTILSNGFFIFLCSCAQLACDSGFKVECKQQATRFHVGGFKEGYQIPIDRTTTLGVAPCDTREK